MRAGRQNSAPSQTDYESIVISPEKTQTVRQMFSRIAPRYDFLNRIMSLGQDIKWRKKVVTKAMLSPTGRILDLGVGTGDFAREVIKQHPDCHIVGLDNCLGLMRIGKQKQGLRQTDWLLANGQQLPFTKGSFDGIVAGFSIRNMADLSHVFDELYRILRPGGTLAILDMIKPVGKISYGIFYFHFKNIVPRLGKLLGSDPDAYAYLLPSIKHFYSIEQLKKALTEHGFKRIRIQTFMFQSVVSCISMKS